MFAYPFKKTEQVKVYENLYKKKRKYTKLLKNMQSHQFFQRKTKHQQNNEMVI